MRVRVMLLCLFVALAVTAGCNRTAAGQDHGTDDSTTTGAALVQEPAGAVGGVLGQTAAAAPSQLVHGKDGAEMVLVPAGKFVMGAPDQHYDQRPVHEMSTGAFYIDKLEVTNAQYKKFVDATSHPVPYLGADFAREYNWIDGTYPPGKEDYPVVLVDWDDATAYAEWAGKRLPTEAEWEKAARGLNGQIFPWGDELDVTRMNTWEAGPGHTTPVGSYPQGASPYSVADMAGNVWEWTADWFDRYPGNDDVSKHYGNTYRVLRGSSWGNVIKYARGSNRHWVEPWTKSTLIGFRCAISFEKP
ncbi:MAG: formylglycine-generating enzyme family protein [Chloroflexi bacterium]|nr:formylglycine-generating enzyme family protein [Chloroflexota bacterium]